MARECPSKWAYIATEDGDYVITSDVEEDIEDEPTSNEDQVGVSVSFEDTCNQWILDQVGVSVSFKDACNQWIFIV